MFGMLPTIGKGFNVACADCDSSGHRRRVARAAVHSASSSGLAKGHNCILPGSSNLSYTEMTEKSESSRLHNRDAFPTWFSSAYKAQ